MENSYAGGAPDKALEAYLKIRAALNRHCSPPGSFLNIRLIAERLKVSTTPVREAVIRLANEEVIGFISGRGYHTRILNSDELAADHEFALVMMRYTFEMKGKDIRDIPAIDLSATWDGEQITEEPLAASVADLVEQWYQALAVRTGNRRIAHNMAEFCARTGPIRRYGLLHEPKILEAVSLLGEVAGALHIGRRGHALGIARRHTRLIIAALPNLVRNLNNHAQATGIPLEDLL